MPLLLGRLFGIPVFVLGVVFLIHYRKLDDPKAMLRKSLRSVWVWLFLILSWLGFAFEVIYLSNQPSGS